MSLDDKLFKVKYVSDDYSHLHPDKDKCRECKSKVCTIICPAHVYDWDDEANKLSVGFENCLECGACRIACPKKAIKWEYPKGVNGVTFKQG